MEEEPLLELTASRRCWLKLLDPIDAQKQMRRDSRAECTLLLFDSRPADVRAGHLIFCVDPQRAAIFALVEVVEDGDTARHDFEASDTRWLFKLPVRVLTIVADRSRAPKVQVAGGATQRFSYRLLTRSQVVRVADALAAAIAASKSSSDNELH